MIELNSRRIQHLLDNLPVQTPWCALSAVGPKEARLKDTYTSIGPIKINACKELLEVDQNSLELILMAPDLAEWYLRLRALVDIFKNIVFNSDDAVKFDAEKPFLRWDDIFDYYKEKLSKHFPIDDLDSDLEEQEEGDLSNG